MRNSLPEGNSFAERVAAGWRRTAPALLLVVLAFGAGSYYETTYKEDKRWLRTIINIVTATLGIELPRR